MNNNIALSPKFLSIDIGGSHIKATVLNDSGMLQMDYKIVPTPSPANPENIINAIKTLAKSFQEYDLISVGFPGYIKRGVIQTAPNLGTDFWKDYDLTKKIESELGKPTRIVNDADMHGLGVVSGKGLEMVVTLGTGFGTALLLDGVLLPHFEFSRHPIANGIDYDEYIGAKALEKEGLPKWNKRIKKVLQILKVVINYDYLYIGGGNSDKLHFKLDKNIKIVFNEDGIKGGSMLWKKDGGLGHVTPDPLFYESSDWCKIIDCQA